MAEEIRLPEWFAEPHRENPPHPDRGGGRGILEKNINAIYSFLREIITPEEFAGKNGILQGLEPRTRLLGIFLLIIAAGFFKDLPSLIAALLLAFSLSLLSKVSILKLLKRMMPVFLFTSILTIPLIFNIVTAGKPLIGIFQSEQFVLSITKEGLVVAATLIIRSASMAAFLFLLFLSSKETDIFYGLRVLFLPRFFITALAMSFRYIFILLEISEDAHLARKARTIRRPSAGEIRTWLASRIWPIIKRSLNISEDVHMAMTARGFKGNLRTISRTDPVFKDYLWLGFTLFILFISFRGACG